jgi:uncharacterized membrane protein
MERLAGYWVYGGTLAGVLLLSLAPLLIGSWPTVLALTFLCLPVYMLHQYEEHDDDRFRRFVNANVGKGREVLSPAGVFVINVPGVWGVITLSLYLASQVNVGFALIAVYLVLVNAAAHIVHGVVSRSYNPGLGTAILLFVPFGGYCLWQVQQTGSGTPVYHAIGLLIAVIIHAAIVLYAKRKQIT